MKYLIWILTALVTVNANTQNNGEDKWGAWYMYSGTFMISDNISIETGAHLRNYEMFNNLHHRFYQVGFNYKISSKLTSGLGYGYLLADLNFEDAIDESAFNEHRIYEYIRLKNNIWKLNVDNRIQLEERFMDFGYKYVTKLRGRYRLQLVLPITDILFVRVYDEILLNIEEQPFDQNRFYTALGININPGYKLQLGYLKHTYSHVAFNRLQFGISMKMDFRRKKVNQ